MVLAKSVFIILLGFSSGTIVAGGIFAFIAVIGIIPRFAQKTRTTEYLSLYEDMITAGGFFGSLTLFINYHIALPAVIAMFITFCMGIFIGCLAVSLAEVLNVVPIFMRRARLTTGLPIFITAIAIGKFVGSLLYFLVPGFYI